MDTQFIARMTDFEARPDIIDRISENLCYYGYCLPSCKGFDDEKWLIQRWTKNGTIEQICYANGERAFSQKWTEREELEYKITAYCSAHE